MSGFSRIKKLRSAVVPASDNMMSAAFALASTRNMTQMGVFPGSESPVLRNAVFSPHEFLHDVCHEAANPHFRK